MVYIIYFSWCLLLFITQIRYLILCVKSKRLDEKVDNKNWLILFSNIFASIFSEVLLIIHAFATEKLGWGIFLFLFIGIGAIALNTIILVISIIFKIKDVKTCKKNNIIKQKLEKKKIKNCILGTCVLIIGIPLLFCICNYVHSGINEKIEEKKYIQTKEEKINKMLEFINDKYDTNYDNADCIYYRVEDYTRHSDMFGNGKTYNIPYIAVFEKNNEKITVVDRKGLISDSGQVDKIGYFIGDYFSKKINQDIEFVQIKKSYNGGIEDYTIAEVIQNDFNKKITNQNIESFVNKILTKEDLELTFYIKDDNNKEKLINNVITNLNYLKKYENIENVIVYVYNKNEDLTIKKVEKEYDEEYKSFNTSDDYYDDYKFDFYYVDEKETKFTMKLHFDLDRGYSPGKYNKNVKIIKDWYIYEY